MQHQSHLLSSFSLLPSTREEKVRAWKRGSPNLPDGKVSSEAVPSNTLVTRPNLLKSFSCASICRTIYHPRGRVLGGSSSINAMIYARGHAFDFNRWDRGGATGWSYADCLPYFKKSETYELGMFVHENHCDFNSRDTNQTPGLIIPRSRVLVFDFESYDLCKSYLKETLSDIPSTTPASCL